MRSSSIAFGVAITPRGQERAGRNGLRSYTPARTQAACEAIRAAWVDAGAQRVPDGTPFRISVIAAKTRPKSHTRKDGSRTAAWRMIPRTPDVDNILKLVLDALQPLCISDDALCSAATVSKHYACTYDSETEPEGIEVLLTWA